VEEKTSIQTRQLVQDNIMRLSLIYRKGGCCEQLREGALHHRQGDRGPRPGQDQEAFRPVHRPSGKQR
jgi:hypothetical protein